MSGPRRSRGIRSVLRWAHGVIGISAGRVLAVIGATGALLSFEPEIVAALQGTSEGPRSVFALHSGSLFGLPGRLLFMAASLTLPWLAISGWWL